MANENVIHVVGTLGKDPELRYTTSGRGVASFSVAVNRRWMNKSTEEWQEETDWMNVVAWAELGENIAASLKKGDRAFVVGRLSNRSYEDREGNKKYISEIVADAVGPDLRFATAVVEKVARDKPAAPRPAQADTPVYGEDEPEPF